MYESYELQQALIESSGWTDRLRRLFQCNLGCSARLALDLTFKNILRSNMGVYIVGFICAIILALLVVGWIAYCMFIKERHKSEKYQYNISDLQHRNYIVAQEQEDNKTEKEVAVGVFVLPSRHKHKENELNKRPDYPESPVHVAQPNTEKLIEILNEDDFHYKDGIYEVDAPHHSEV